MQVPYYFIPDMRSVIVNRYPLIDRSFISQNELSYVRNTSLSEDPIPKPQQIKITNPSGVIQSRIVNFEGEKMRDNNFLEISNLKHHQRGKSTSFLNNKSNQSIEGDKSIFFNEEKTFRDLGSRNDIISDLLGSDLNQNDRPTLKNTNYMASRINQLEFDLKKEKEVNMAVIGEKVELERKLREMIPEGHVCPEQQESECRVRALETLMEAKNQEIFLLREKIKVYEDIQGLMKKNGLYSESKIDKISYSGLKELQSTLKMIEQRLDKLEKTITESDEPANRPPLEKGRSKSLNHIPTQTTVKNRSSIVKTESSIPIPSVAQQLQILEKESEKLLAKNKKFWANDEEVIRGIGNSISDERHDLMASYRKLAEIEKRVQKMNAENEVLGKLRGALQQELTVSRRRSKASQLLLPGSKNKDLTRTFKLDKSRIKDLEEKLSLITNQNFTLNQLLNQRLTELEQLREKCFLINALQSGGSSKEEAVVMIERTLTEKNKEIEELRRKCIELEKKREFVNKYLNPTAETRGLRKILKEKDRELNLLKEKSNSREEPSTKEIENEKDVITELKRVIQEREKAISDLAEEKENMDLQRKQLLGELESILSNKELEEELEHAKFRLEETVKENNVQKVTIKGLNEQINGLKKEIRAFEEKENSTKQERKRLELEKIKAENLVTTLKSSKDNLEKQKAMLVETCDKLELRNHDLETVIADLELRISSQQSEISSINMTLLEKNEELSMFMKNDIISTSEQSSKLKYQDRMIVLQNEELKTLKQQLTSMDKLVKAQRDERNSRSPGARSTPDKSFYSNFGGTSPEVAAKEAMINVLKEERDNSMTRQYLAIGKTARLEETILMLFAENERLHSVIATVYKDFEEFREHCTRQEMSYKRSTEDLRSNYQIDLEEKYINERTRLTGLNQTLIAKINELNEKITETAIENEALVSKQVKLKQKLELFEKDKIEFEQYKIKSETLHNVYIQHARENDFLKNIVREYEGKLSLLHDLEMKLAYCMKENERLHALIVERCKSQTGF